MKRMRASGIAVLGDIPWGTHFCQFYRTDEDLLDILVPYFGSGLKDNEFCMWITSSPLGVEAARRAMKDAFPDFDEYLERGQIEILPHTVWYLEGERFDSGRVLNKWIEKLNAAVARGYEGLRLTGNTFWLEKKDWKNFLDYEDAVNKVIVRYPMIALCTHSLDKCGITELLDVALAHGSALIKKEGEWVQMESSATKQLGTFADKVLSSSPNGLYIYDLKEGINTFINPQYTKLTGYTLQDIHSMSGPEFFALFHPEDRARVAAHMKAISRAADGDILEIEYRFKTAGGDWIWCFSRDTVFERADDGGVRQILGTFLDITARKRMEDPLLESEQKFRFVLENSLDAAYRRNLQTDQYDYMSPVIEKITGYSVDEMKNLGIDEVLQLIHPDDRQKVVQGIEGTWTGGTGILEYRFKGKDGEYRWLADTISVLKDGERRPLYGVGIVRDVTVRKRAEEALRQSEERYRSLFNGMSEGFALHEIICDEKGVPCDYRFLDVNPAFERLTGLKRKEVLGKRTSEALPDNDPHWVKIYGEVALSGRTIHFENYSSALKRHYRVFAYRPAPSQFATIFTDITERKQMEEALDSTQSNYRELVENANSAIIRWKRDGTITFFNEYAQAFFGYSADEVIGRDVNILVPETESNGRDLTGLVRDVVRHPERYVNNINENICRDGSRVWMTWTNKPIFGEDGQVAEILAVGSDITERKKLEEEVRRSRDELEVRVQERTAELERSNRELQDFAFIASHDLQEPLRKIRTFGDMIADKSGNALSDESLDYLARMQRAAARMKNLLDSLLDYSRVTTKAAPFELTDLNKSVAEALSNLEIVTKDKKGKVEVGCLPSVESDRIQMLQVFQNLIGNALKFHREGEAPFINIHGSPVGSGKNTDCCRIFVEDNGIGFDEKYLDRIFAPFQRLHGRSGFEGVGMGLAICKKIVERHGGDITAKSIPGKGSVFIITLPLRQKKR